MSAVLETYASGSIETWVKILCTRSNPRLKRKWKPVQVADQTAFSEHTEESELVIKPDLCEE